MVNPCFLDMYRDITIEFFEILQNFMINTYLFGDVPWYHHSIFFFKYCGILWLIQIFWGMYHGITIVFFLNTSEYYG